MEIDVSVSPSAQPEDADATEDHTVKHFGLYPVASMQDRRIAAVIDIVCLLFAYGGFMALFSSLGGQFSASKLNAAVYFATFAVVYLQYFALFTIFGGTTPGMMFRGLQGGQLLWRASIAAAIFAAQPRIRFVRVRRIRGICMGMVG